MLSHFLLVLAAGVLSAALRSYRHPVIHKAGTIGIFITSFLAGWLMTGSVALGAAFLLSWLLLPWVEILTRIRHVRLPIDRDLRPQSPPNCTLFPAFNELTDEIEDSKFEQVADVGWSHEDTRHFYRLFHRSSMEAAICLTEQNEMAFYYLSLTTRTKSGEVYTTWNYPFSYSLKVSPKLKINRVHGEVSFKSLVADHERFIGRAGICENPLDLSSTGAIHSALERDMREQIRHNLKLGLLKKDGDSMIRYSVRGMFFLWIQYLRDLVRLS